MEKFSNINEVKNFGFEVEKSLEGQYRLMYNGYLVYEDPANEDLYEEEMAEVYMVNGANDYYEKVSEYMGAIVDLGAGPSLVEDFDSAVELYNTIKRNGCEYYTSDDSEKFEDICSRLELDVTKATKVGWIGANVCACICLSSDYNF